MGCDKCGGTGFILFEDSEGREWARKCDCYSKMVAENMLNKSGISEAFRMKTLDNFDGKNIKTLEVAKIKAQDYIDRFENIEHKTENSFLLLGQPGSGKTHLALAMGNALLRDKNVGVLYMSYKEAMTNLKQLERKDKYAFDSQIHKYTYARLLIIDDLFKGEAAEVEKGYIFQIINARYLAKLPFIVSSEKTHLELIDIDEAIGSRLIEQARGHSVLFEGKELNHRIRG